MAADGIPDAVTCLVLDLPRSTFYDAKTRLPSALEVADAQLTGLIGDVHTMSRGSYGAHRVHAELRLGLGLPVARKRVARLMRQAEICGLGEAGKTRRRRPDPAVHDDLVQRRFVADERDRLCCTDITEHPTAEGKVHCCAVLDGFSRQTVGWSIADHLRSELVVHALQMATWRRHPPTGTVGHSDRGSVYTSWVFGHRLRQAGLLGSMGRVASSVDNSVIESFWSTMQRELLDTRRWQTKPELAAAIFEWVEAWHNPRRRHTRLGMQSPVEYEALHTGRTRGMITTPTVSGEPGQDPPTSGERCGADGLPWLQRLLRDGFWPPRQRNAFMPFQPIPIRREPVRPVPLPW
ncbi:MAG: IS3 family transposase [Actinomycetota bacterium]|nr:IS3 family transposase [Actinomycetota bacterium]